MSSATSRPRRLSAEQRQRDLVAVARAEFLRRGFPGTTTQRVAKKAGVSESLVLKYFRSKHQLFERAVGEPIFEAFRTFAGRAAELQSQTHRSRDDSISDLKQFLIDWANAVRREREAIILALAHIRSTPGFAARMRDVAYDFTKGVTELILQVVGSGKPIPQMDAGAIAVTTLTSTATAAFLEVDLDAFVGTHIDLIVLGFRAADPS